MFEEFILQKNDSDSLSRCVSNAICEYVAAALLVERGDCSFEEKARNVMLHYPAISYMIVYDDMVSKNNLVPMKETNSSDGIDVGMLFVSYRAGMSTLFLLLPFTCFMTIGKGIMACSFLIIQLNYC